ncbi:glycosyltransferase family 4 protein [Trueperella bialowiezensis]|uniref:D-inositol-3-phosphate glycosyltransferase n=1 Tax=Trueperella bialowiezensis TaxID=312285 RepID=A0A3S4VFE5_9ACTO|nr:glycosyltransferase family 4 protein [Trueperella bialowiezensis]VEI12920.1 D-inositol-3-phosphate glycosyltransferase [Trueperella bialowiezensis]
MKVCVVTSWFPTDVKPGAGSFVATDARALAHDHDVRIVHFVDPHLDDGRRTINLDGIPGIRVPLQLTNPLSWIRAIRRAYPYLKNADVVHTMAFSSLLKILPVPFSAPVVHTEHWHGMMRIRSSRFARLEKLAVKITMARPTVASGVSSYLASEVEALSGRDVRVIPNIVDAPPLLDPPQPEPSPQLRILSVGYLSPIKDPLMAVRALGVLRERGVDAHLAWAGTGDMEADVLELAEQLGVAQSLTLLGHVSRQELFRQLEMCNVVLHTSTEETFSLVAAEALVAGRPLVIQERGGHTDFAREPYTTFVHTRTPEAFADAIERAGEIGRTVDFTDVSRQLRHNFSEDAFRERWSQVYREVTA